MIVFVYTKTPVLLLLLILITHSLYIQHTNYSWQYSILPFVLLSIFCVLALRYLVLSILHHVTMLMSTFPDSICKRRSLRAWLISLFTKTKFFWLYIYVSLIVTVNRVDFLPIHRHLHTIENAPIEIPTDVESSLNFILWQ